MNAPPPISQRDSPRPAVKTLVDFRLIPRIETFPRVVLFAQTPLGKILLLAAFGLELRFFASSVFPVLQMVVPLAVVTFMPEYRRFVLALSPLFFLLVQGGPPLMVGLRLGAVAAGMGLFWCARRWPKSWFSQRPIAFLISGFSLLLLLGCVTSPLAWSYRLTWSLVVVGANYIWFIGYALIDRNAKPAADASLELASFHPLWGLTNVPMPKGAAYYRRIEARDEQQLALVQLKGLKLLAWAILLAVLSNFSSRFFHVFLRIPDSTEALAMSVQRVPLAWTVRWESIVLGFVEKILGITIVGHRVIACCRMAGFNALRNTYRPLSSTTVAEFFNRIFFYFKELLVDFFFYPTFLRYWKGHLRVRLIFATFSAAFFGNAFFHFILDCRAIRLAGLVRALANFQASLFYFFLLAAALSISQIRKRGPRPTGFVRGRLWPAFCVLTFYCLLGVFDIPQQHYPLTEHLRFLASLFFIRL